MKRLGMITVLAFLRASIFSADPNPADSEIKLGGFDLRLGMSQAETLETLRVAYNVTFVETSKGDWAVWSHDGPPYKLIGLVGFGHGKLRVVSKSWFPSDGTPKDFAQAVLDASRSVSGRQCSVSANDKGPYRTVEFVCGRRTLRIAISSEADSGPSLVEEIRAGE